MSRLAWINSAAGTDPDFIVQPFTPVVIGGANRHELSILGRTIALGANGLPDRIMSYFTPEMTSLATTPEAVLAQPIDLRVMVGGQAEALRPQAFQVTQEARGRVTWTAESRSPSFRMAVHGALEYDGMLEYRIELEALGDVSVDDIVMPVALVPDAAEYMLGLGRKGGMRPARVDWTWKVENHQEGVWLGGVHKGLQYVLRDDNYERPLNTNFYQSKPLNLPPSWYNAGRGGIRIETAAGAVTATNYSGRAGVAGRRDAALQCPLPGHAVQADRHTGAFQHPLRAQVRARRRGEGLRRHRRQHPPRERHQSVHQLSVLQPGQADRVHRGGPRQGHQGQALRHHPRTDVSRARALCAAQPGRRDPQ